MDILVIGGTSFLGKVIVELLLETGHQVTIFTRGNKRPEFWDRVEHITGDRTDRDSFRQKLSRRTFDIVIDNIAYNAEDVQTTLKTLGGSVGRYMLTSTGAVYLSGTLTMPISEDDVNHQIDNLPGIIAGYTEQEISKLPDMHAGYTELVPDGMRRYVIGKIRAERTLIEQDAVPYTIIRLPVVVGPEDPSLRAYFYFQRLRDGGPLILTNGGVQSIHLAYSRDAAHGYLLALTSKRTINQVYNLAQRETVRLVDWLLLAAHLLEVKPTFVSIPADVLRTSGFNYPEPLTFVATFFMNTHKAEIDLGYKTTPQAAWTKNTVHWYRDFYSGPDSMGYKNRQKEIKFAQMYQQAVSALSDNK